jgi:hypothetical protein
MYKPLVAGRPTLSLELTRESGGDVMTHSPVPKIETTIAAINVPEVNADVPISLAFVSVMRESNATCRADRIQHIVEHEKGIRRMVQSILRKSNVKGVRAELIDEFLSRARGR